MRILLALRIIHPFCFARIIISFKRPAASSFRVVDLRPSSDAELFMNRTQCKLGKSLV